MAEAVGSAFFVRFSKGNMGFRVSTIEKQKKKLPSFM